MPSTTRREVPHAGSELETLDALLQYCQETLLIKVFRGSLKFMISIWIRSIVSALKKGKSVKSLPHKGQIHSPLLLLLKEGLLHFSQFFL
jgi:hypothetical protein